jgi:cell wall-associated NlpC family hydrolase
MPRRYTADGRAGRIIARGKPLNDDLAGLLLSGKVELSTAEVSQITLTFADPSLTLLGSRLFDPPRQVGAAGSALDYAGLRFEVAAVEVGDDSGVTTLGVVARSLGMQKLRRPFNAADTPVLTPVYPMPGQPGFIGPVTQDQINAAKSLPNPAPAGGARGLSPTDWVRQQAEYVGLRFRGEESATRDMIAPTTDDQTKQTETLWAVIQRLAKELGFVAFESAGVLYFGRPTWLADHATSLRVNWGGTPSPGGLLSPPKCRRTGDDPKNHASATIDLSFAATLDDQMTPGMALDLTGVPTFAGRYLVQSVSIPLADDEPIALSAATPINPEPEPPGAGAAGASGSWSGIVDDNGAPQLAAGSFAGVALSGEQLSNAGIIWHVGRQMGADSNDRIMSIMCAMQESSLVNLTGGDRDSAGLFQQRPSMGWGTYKQVTTPTYAARKFFSVLFKESNRTRRERWAVIQAVQRSGFPRAYAKWESMAIAVCAALDATINAPGAGTVTGQPTGTAAAFVQYALQQAGDPYVFGAETRLEDNDPDAFDCSELVEWAAYRAGVKFVDGARNQWSVCRAKGLLIPISDAYNLRGALLFRINSGAYDHVAISLGDGRTIEAKGRQYGVGVFPATSRGWTAAGKVPGLDYNTPLPRGWYVLPNGDIKVPGGRFIMR